MASTISEEENDLITCSVCLNEYDPVERKPKFLPCAHTVCVVCLQAIINLLDGQFKCPICRQISVVQNVISLPNNLYALHMLKSKEEKMKQDAAATINPKLIKWCLNCNAAEKPLCPSVHTVQNMTSEAIEHVDLHLKLKEEFLQRKHQGMEKLMMAIEISKKVRGQLNKISKSIDDASKQLNKLLDINDSQVAHLNSVVENLKISISSNEDKRSIVKETISILENSNPLNMIEKLRMEMNDSVENWDKKLRDSKDYAAIYASRPKTKIVMQMYDENHRPIRTWLNAGFRLESSDAIMKRPLVRAYCELINHAAFISTHLTMKELEKKPFLLKINSEQTNLASNSIAHTLPSLNAFALDQSIFIMKFYIKGILAGEIRIRPMTTGLSSYHQEFMQKLGEFCYKSPKEFNDFIESASKTHVLFKFVYQLSPQDFKLAENLFKHTSTSVFQRDCKVNYVWLNLTQRDETLCDMRFMFPLEGCKNTNENFTSFMSHAVRFGRILSHRVMLMKPISYFHKLSLVERQKLTLFLESDE